MFVCKSESVCARTWKCKCKFVVWMWALAAATHLHQPHTHTDSSCWVLRLKTPYKVHAYGTLIGYCTQLVQTADWAQKHFAHSRLGTETHCTQQTGHRNTVHTAWRNSHQCLNCMYEKMPVHEVHVSVTYDAHKARLNNVGWKGALRFPPVLAVHHLLCHCLLLNPTIQQTTSIMTPLNSSAPVSLSVPARWPFWKLLARTTGTFKDHT